MTGQCENLSADRKLGERWEREFCKLAAAQGFVFTPMQIGKESSAQFFSNHDGWKHYTLPDITIWTFPGQHHEIKHKNPTPAGAFGLPPMYGLEAYRYHALATFATVTQQDVLYTIHNHDLSGGRNGMLNDLSHWFTLEIDALDVPDYVQRNGKTWVNGQRQENVKILYWHADKWMPLQAYWEHD